MIKPQDPPIFYKRKIFDSDDPAYPGTFAVDFVTSPYEGSEPPLPPRTTHFTQEEFQNYGSLDSKPMLIALHGLSGGSYEVYLRQCFAPLVGDGGWEGAVVTSRGCAGSKVTSSTFYNARASWDTRQTVKWLRKTFPNRPLFGIGYSLGANILANYLGEEGENCQLKAAVLCSNPWDLEVSSVALHQSWLGLNVYSKALAGNLKKVLIKHLDQINKDAIIDVDKVMKAKTLGEFDRHVQCPSWGYPTERAYYRDSSSSDSMLAIKIPFLAINAEDDPIAVKQAIPFGELTQNQFGVLVSTALGGHLGWFESGGTQWFAKAVSSLQINM
ncbi:MAG: hypothetical protein Q9227_003013 [Pyrenula ochraceoflavens]